MKEKFVISFSGGKDSTLALYRMIKMGYEPVALLITVKKDSDKSWTHNLNRKLLKDVSENLNIKLLEVECDALHYENEFEKSLKKAKELGANICAFGDIDIEEHKNWDTKRCEAVGIKPMFPLWQENRESLVYEFIDSGFTTIVKTVNLNYLDKSYLGKKLTKELVEKIKKTGSDACGENGEYHTFVVDGPLFKEKINFKINGIKIEKNYGHLDIE